MSISAYVEGIYQNQTTAFLECDAFLKLENGLSDPAAYDAFICNVYQTHQNSPKYFSFLMCVAPPKATERIKHNLLEELGVDEEDGYAHPDLLEALIHGAGLAHHMFFLRSAAQSSMRETICDPLLYASLRELGLAAMVEVFSFEYMLAHASTRIANMLASHRGLGEESLIWFRHHSEVDIAHAQEALLTIDDTYAYYDFDEEEAKDIIDMALRENVFIKRYFDTFALAQSMEFL
ncbi:MAG: hypothetical protein CL916_08900 [Deltaproteobacteria bacterium]|nr:hypothetical protein [Deltaproteobacteria bacterium]